MADNNHELTGQEMKLYQLEWHIVHFFCSEDNCDLASEMIDWLKDNDILHEWIARDVEHEVVDWACRIWVSSDEDAMAFKLRWAE